MSKQPFKKLTLNVEVSLKLCKPTENPHIHPDFKDATKFIERKIIPLSDVIYDPQFQIRVLEVNMEKALNLHNSFVNLDYNLKEFPPMVIKHPTIFGKWLGITGYTRNMVFTNMPIEHMLYDVYHFETPLALSYFNGHTNSEPLPKNGQTKRDIAKQVIDMVDRGEIAKDNKEAIQKYINWVARERSANERLKIYKYIEEETQSVNLKTYHSGVGFNSTEEAGKLLGIAYGGDKGICDKNKRYGYISHNSQPGSTLRSIKNSCLKQNSLLEHDIHIYVQSPVHARLETDRKLVLRLTRKEIENEAKFIKMLINSIQSKKSSIKDITLDDIIEALPYNISGFLPQDKTADNTKGGNPKEMSIVTLSEFETPPII